MGASMTEASRQHPSVQHLGFCVTNNDVRTSFVVTQNPNRAATPGFSLAAGPSQARMAGSRRENRRRHRFQSKQP
jgi:hypothetical protein